MYWLGICLAISLLANLAAVASLMRSIPRIDLRRPVDNRARKFGSAKVYYQTECVLGDGRVVPMLLTESAVLTAIRRQQENLEDL